MKLFSSALLSFAALHQLVADAWTISPGDAVSSTGSANEPLSKTWTITGATANDVLTKLELSTIGRVFVKYDSSLGAGTAATVVVTGDSSDLLDAFEVINDKDEPAAIKLHIKNENFRGQGYLATQVKVGSKQAICELSTAHSSDVVVGDDVLAQDDAKASVALALAGSGDLYAGSSGSSWTLKELAVAIAGSGDVQFLAKSLELADVAAGVAGSGNVALVADKLKVSNGLAAAVAGSGDITVQSRDLSAFNLTAGIAGSGDVTFAGHGSCQQQHIVITGSGEVSSGSIVCVDTDIGIIGSGDVLVQTTGNLHVASMFHNDVVHYYGATPHNITVDRGITFRGRDKNTKAAVRETKKNRFHEYEVKPLPPHEPLYVVLTTRAARSGDEPSVNVFELDEYNAAAVDEYLRRQDAWGYGMQSWSAQVAPHAPGLALFAVVGGALVAVGVAATKYKRRQERKLYAPLV